MLYINDIFTYSFMHTELQHFVLEKSKDEKLN